MNSDMANGEGWLGHAFAFWYLLVRRGLLCVGYWRCKGLVGAEVQWADLYSRWFCGALVGCHEENMKVIQPT